MDAHRTELKEHLDDYKGFPAGEDQASFLAHACLRPYLMGYFD